MSKKNGDDNLDGLLKGLHPDEVVRVKHGKKYFGLGHTAQADAIKAGKIPKPFSIVEGGRAKGWLGKQILEHHRRRQASADDSGEAA